MAALVLILAVLVVAVLLVAALAYAARRRWRRLGVTLAVLAVVVASYAGTLVAVGVSAPTRDLAIGEWKCFDEWCVTLTSATPRGDAIEVVLAVQNRGRREQAPDSPHAWLLLDGQRNELVVPELGARIAGGSTRQLPPLLVSAPTTQHPRLLITEGGFPSVLTIGDDNSPFHPQPAWPLS
jgi:hypothetical protein